MARVKKNPTPFYVINEDVNVGDFRPYNVMDYFIEEYKAKKPKDRPTTFEEFRDFVKGRSMYRFWSRCEYEILLAHWPFGSYRLHNELKEFLATNQDLTNINNSIKLDNIIMRDMSKTDVHVQVMMNIDVVVKILMENVGL